MTRPARVGIVLASLALLLAGRVLFESRREWKGAEREARSGRTEEEIHRLARSIRWYLPGNPFTGRAIRRLWELGETAEASDPKRALLAYDSLRGSLHAVRSFYWPHKEWILRADERIAVLRAREQAAREPGLSFERALEFHRKVLVPDERPRLGWTLAVEAGFFGFLLSVLLWIWKGFDREGRMQVRSSLPWIAGIVVSLTLWVIALARA